MRRDLPRSPSTPEPRPIPPRARASRRSIKPPPTSSTTWTTPHRCSIWRRSATSTRASAARPRPCWSSASPRSKAARRRWRSRRATPRRRIVFHTLMEPGDEFVAGRQLYGGSVNQFNHAFKKFDWHVAWADATEPETFAQGDHAQDQGHLLRVDRQSRRHHRRPAGHLGHRQEGRRAADRRQHAGDALPVPAQGVRRRHHHPLAHQVHGRARQLHRRRHRRLRHLRLARVQAEIPDADRSQPQLQRHAAGRDLRQLRLRHRLPRDGPARSRARDLALQRVPDPHRHRDAAAAHGQALRERAGRRQASRRSTSRSSG